MAFVEFLVGHLWLIALGLIVSRYVWQQAKSWYRLRHFPGPFVASLSYLWVARVALSGRYADKYRDVSQRYGHLARIGPNVLTTDDPDVIRKLSATKSSAWRDSWYEGGRWDPYHLSMFNLLDPESHDRLKAKMARGYGGRDTEGVEPAVDGQINSLLSLIRRKYLSTAGETRLLDFARLSSFFTMDVITKIAFGDAFGCLTTDSDMFNFHQEVANSLPALLIAVEVPWIRSIIFSRPFLKLFGPKKTDPAGVGRLLGVGSAAVEKRFAGESQDRRDILGSFMRSGLTQRECEAEAVFMIIAGSDTTASAIRTTMLHLMTTPLVYRKFKQVIAEAVGEGSVSSPITNEEAKAIPYLRALILEGLRMRPPTPGLFAKSVPPGGDTFRGQFVPGGTAIGVNLGSMVLNAEVFGEDARLFRPERFLEGDAAKLTERERTVELLFGSGRWMCAGKPIAFMELHKVYFELMRHFDFQLADPRNPWDSHSYSVYVEKNMWVKVTEAKEV